MTNYDFAVIGATGAQGRIVIHDLLECGYSVLMLATDAFGLDNFLHSSKVRYKQIDLRQIEKTAEILKAYPCKIAINCAIKEFNVAVSKLALELGLHYVDLGSTEEQMQEQFLLNDLFKKKNLTAITGAGSTPGITNVMLHYVRPLFDTIDTVKLGFAWNSNTTDFVVPFCLDTLDNEFTNPGKMFMNGNFTFCNPEDCTEEFDYLHIGKQKTIFVQHIEPYTFHKYLKDSGVKNILFYASFPAHSYDTIKSLISLGLTSRKRLNISEQPVTPLEVTTEVLRRQPVPKGYTEHETLWLKVWGKKDGRDVAVEMDAYTETQPGLEEFTCNIDTGMPASVIGQMLVDGRITARGVFSPEFCVPPAPFFEEMERRSIYIYMNRKRLIAQSAPYSASAAMYNATEDPWAAVITSPHQKLPKSREKR